MNLGIRNHGKFKALFSSSCWSRPLPSGICLLCKFNGFSCVLKYTLFCIKFVGIVFLDRLKQCAKSSCFIKYLILSWKSYYTHRIDAHKSWLLWYTPVECTPASHITMFNFLFILFPRSVPIHFSWLWAQWQTMEGEKKHEKRDFHFQNNIVS